MDPLLQLRCLGWLFLGVTLVMGGLVATRTGPGARDPPFVLLRQIMAGGVAAALAESVFYPIEVCKVRMQTSTAAPGQRRGFLATLRDMARKEGLNGSYQAPTPSTARLYPFLPLPFSLAFALSSRHTHSLSIHHPNQNHRMQLMRLTRLTRPSCFLLPSFLPWCCGMFMCV